MKLPLSKTHTPPNNPLGDVSLFPSPLRPLPFDPSATFSCIRDFLFLSCGLGSTDNTTPSEKKGEKRACLRTPPPPSGIIIKAAVVRRRG
jgi:hypothetical protein